MHVIEKWFHSEYLIWWDDNAGSEKKKKKKPTAFDDQVNKRFLHLDLLIDKICFWIFLL